MSLKVAVDKSKPVVNVYTFISSSPLSTTNILVPSLLKATEWGFVPWVSTTKPVPSPFMSSKVAAACAELTKVRLKIINIDNIFFK